MVLYEIICVLGHDSALRLYWAGDNLGLWDECCYESCPCGRIDRSTYWPGVQRATTELWVSSDAVIFSIICCNTHLSPYLALYSSSCRVFVIQPTNLEQWHTGILHHFPQTQSSLLLAGQEGMQMRYGGLVVVEITAWVAAVLCVT